MTKHTSTSLVAAIIAALILLSSCTTMHTTARNGGGCPQAYGHNYSNQSMHKINRH